MWCAEERAEKTLKSASTRKTTRWVSSVFCPSSPRFTPPSHRASPGFRSWLGQRQYFFKSLCCWSPVKTGKLLRLWQIWSLASRCNQVAPSGSRGNLGGRWIINSLTSKHWLFDISAINPLCDLDDLLCQGLVQVSENYELDPPGVSGNYDWRSTSFCTREAEEPWFVSKALASKYSLLLILSLSWVFPFKLTV